jgi:predicted RNase H-like HicB family nuclease
MPHKKPVAGKKKSTPPEAARKSGLVFNPWKLDREEDGRWIAEIPEMAGVMVYGESREDALVRVQALAYRVLADRIAQERAPQPEVRFAVA